MAKNKATSVKVRMDSTAGTGYRYYLKKTRNLTEKMQFRKYDPIARKHVIFKEGKMPPSKKN